MELISVVVPCYNEEEVIKETHSRLAREVEKIAINFNVNYEIIYVNDGSKDKTLQILQSLKNIHPIGSGNVVIISLAKNFGHQTALTAGLNFAKGDAIISIDADLQDPPEVIEEMMKKWKEGMDVVYGVRTSREGETWFKLMTAKLFYIIVRKITKFDIPLNAGDFRLISKRALEVFKSMPERNRFIRGMIPWIGLNQIPIYYERASRFAGTTKYPFSKMLKLALDGIVGFSNSPLKTAYYVGFVIALLSFAYGIFIIFYSLLKGFPVHGWSSIMVTILFTGGVQLITVGILGEYIGRIYDEVKKRPLYIIDEQESRF
ncbi:glycosyltransferase family 2 protein [Silvanigrella aquatica]|uniref:Glycosyltransferase n=1 Tax=Silvanigrella aquatica TaxID=1915309 RepID=A0A1L4D268_9BACT|nr:glycosyltransferase family 2 protein [Silvanigrella aquatica]APJ04287.1 glycosyltransferase [Silvanigrella aquatica]